jgi:hypothetical protein
LKQTPHLQWFHVQKRFFLMGVKMIGAFCDAIRETDLIDREVPGGFPGDPRRDPRIRGDHIQ